MYRKPVSNQVFHQKTWMRLKSSSSIRTSFIDYFVENHGHKHIKSSSVVPISDPTVPFVNAGMNQFKAVLLGNVGPPCPRAVNSQKCIRVGGKHNDLDIVGTDGHHHTFFEMLGNWSFGDYYKKEACQMAWDLLLGPYRLKPEDLVVTYFSGDAAIGMQEDRECRDIWKQIGVSGSRLLGKGASDNFWEMGTTGPCGPCTEIHYVNKDGSLTEIWNLVFIQCNREASGKVSGLRQQHVDTGMGLERMATLLQKVPSNYDTDLFRPIINAIQRNSKGVSPYTGQYGSEAILDSAYRRLADHARMIAICLADGAFPATSLNLKQIMRKSFKISNDVFQNPNLLSVLYNEVVSTLGSSYPELIAKEKEAKLIISHEAESYAKMKAELVKRWKGLVKKYPEVEVMSDVETTGFALGYKEFKETMAKQKSNAIPGELVFKLYDTHGFQEDVIDRIAKLNNLEIDKKGFLKLLSQHRTRHKTSFKEQNSTNGLKFDEAIETLIKKGVTSTNDKYKYDYKAVGNKVQFRKLKTNVVAILNEDCDWIDFLDPCENRPYYLVTRDTNFYCEEGGQIADTGTIRLNEDVCLNVDSVFKIRDFVFHKGTFNVNKFSDNKYINCESEVTLEIDSDRRLNIMRNHTAVHLLNAAVRKVLPNSVVCPLSSKVTDRGLCLNLSVYGQKLSQDVVLEVQNLVRESIQVDAPLETRIIDSIQVSAEPELVTIPGETYPETGLRMVTVQSPLLSKELCCGTHLPSTALLEEFCVTLVKGAAGHTPIVHALTGEYAKEARELFCRAEKLSEVVELVSPDRKSEEISEIRERLAGLCGRGGTPAGEYAACLQMLDSIHNKSTSYNDVALSCLAAEEIQSACLEAAEEGRRFVVHFLRCSYLMSGDKLADVLASALADTPATPALLLGCAGGTVIATAMVPKECARDSFTAEKWVGSVAPVFGASVLPAPSTAPHKLAHMSPSKVSLINCEQLVQDAMRVAIKFAQAQLKDTDSRHTHDKNRHTN